MYIKGVFVGRMLDLGIEPRQTEQHQHTNDDNGTNRTTRQNHLRQREIATRIKTTLPLSVFISKS